MAPVLALLVGPDRAAPCAPPAGDFSRQTKYSTCQHQYKNPQIKHKTSKTELFKTYHWCSRDLEVD